MRAGAENPRLRKEQVQRPGNGKVLGNLETRERTWGLVAGGEGASAGDEAGVGEGTTPHGLAGRMTLLVKPKCLEQLQWSCGGRRQA